MIYTIKSPALLIIGILMLVWGGLNTSGALDGVQSYLQKSAYGNHMTVKAKFDFEARAATEIAAAEGKPAPAVMKMPASSFDAAKADQARIVNMFGGTFLLIGLFTLLWKPKQGDLDYFISVVPGIAFILLIVVVVRWVLDPIFGNLGRAVQDAGILSWNFARIFNLNHIVLGILAGIIAANVFKIPAWAGNGVRTARLGLKTGVILLGTLYSAKELAQLGVLSVVMIGIFVLGSVWLVLIMGKRMQCTNSMTGVLSAGIGVCGVSAAVAAAPVVKATAEEIAYTIGTVLIWGVGCMFLFPTVGHLLEMGPVQFGAWAGTGILNSAQVAGAALAFDPNGIETLKVAEIFNITRVLFLPLIVLWLAAWYMKHEVGAEKINLTQVVISKFPLFVLGFIGMFAMSTMGVFAPADHYQGKYFSSAEVKQDKLLSGKALRALDGELTRLRGAEDAQVLSKFLVEKTVVIESHRVTSEEVYKAFVELIANKKMMTRDQSYILFAVSKMEGLDPGAKGAIDNAKKAAEFDSKVITAYRDWLVWLFGFGLVGLGMQITGKSLKQAGGMPLIIGGTVGTVKAVGSLIVVMLFVKEFI